MQGSITLRAHGDLGDDLRELGLSGVSGVPSDMRARLASSVPYTHEAIDLFCQRAQRTAHFASRFGRLALGHSTDKERMIARNTRALLQSA